jgi:hypothetical protein
MGKTKGKGNTTLRGRDAGTGRFMKVEDARKDPKHTVVERVPKPGKGVK